MEKAHCILQTHVSSHEVQITRFLSFTINLLCERFLCTSVPSGMRQQNITM